LRLIRGTIASGVASNSAASARRLKGVKSWITTNASNYSGVSLTETILNDIFEAQWNQGASADAVYGPMKASDVSLALPLVLPSKLTSTTVV
jgi:hypothetical protein